jgi:ACS family glucarate transporter-like MFS transporter
MGFFFSGFGWAYVAGQLPSGGLLDRFGSKRVYGISIVAGRCALADWACRDTLAAAWAFSVIFGLRLLSGLGAVACVPG